MENLTKSLDGSEWATSISPENNYIAYTSDESGQYEIQLIPYPPNDQKWQISNKGGLEPKWSSNGAYFLIKKSVVEKNTTTQINVITIFLKK